MSKKLPAMLFYPGDWLKDPALALCSPATRGIWFDLLCAMHELGRRGQVIGTPEQLARICRCTAADVSCAVAELASTGAADVQDRHGVFTLINRRMNREAKVRQDAAVRQVRCRGRKSGAAVTDDVAHVSRDSHIPISSSSSVSSQEPSNEGSENTISAKPEKRFVAPTIEEGRAYCQERGNSIDPEAFVAYYEARDWFSGKTKIRKWKQAVLTWEKNERERTKQKSSSRVGPGQRFVPGFDADAGG